MPEALHVVEHDDRALALRQRREPRVQPGTQIRLFGGVVPSRREVFTQRLGLAHTAAARAIERRVGDDAVEPSAEGLARKEATERAVRMQEAVLHGILRV